MASPGRPRPRPPRNAAPIIRSVGRPWAPHKDIYHFLIKRSWMAFFGFVGLGFLVVNAFFGWVYTLDPNGITNARPGAFEDAFFFSVQTMATIGYGSMAPVTRFTHLVVTFEALIGILSVALVTGITFSKFSRPTARILFSESMVVSPRNGVPHLMFRLANSRHNQVIEAQLRLVLLVTERTLEGDTLRRPHELPLVRDRHSVFFLTWQAMHKIDESSPFYGPGALERLREANAELFATLQGLDETVGQTINARQRYTLEDIAWSSRFKDIFTTLESGIRQIDYRRFHEIEKLTAGMVADVTDSGRLVTDEAAAVPLTPATITRIEAPAAALVPRPDVPEAAVVADETAARRGA